MSSRIPALISLLFFAFQSANAQTETVDETILQGTSDQHAPFTAANFDSLLDGNFPIFPEDATPFMSDFLFSPVAAYVGHSSRIRTISSQASDGFSLLRYEYVHPVDLLALALVDPLCRTGLTIDPEHTTIKPGLSIGLASEILAGMHIVGDNICPFEWFRVRRDDTDEKFFPIDHNVFLIIRYSLKTGAVLDLTLTTTPNDPVSKTETIYFPVGFFQVNADGTFTVNMTMDNHAR